MKSSRLVERITNNWPAKILSVAAAVLLFFFYRISTLEQRYITVPLDVVANGYYIPSAPLPATVRVTLRGKADTIFGIRESDIEAYVDLTTYHGEGVYRVPIQIHKKGSALNVDVEMRVDPIDVAVKLERAVQKTVQVFANIKGFPARGYQLGQYLLTPDQVVVEGPQSRVDAVADVSTDPIDLTGKSADFTARVELDVTDPTIRIIGNESVEFHGMVQPIVIIKTIEPIDIVPMDLAPDLRLRADVTTGSIRVQGNQLAVERIKPGDITLSIDCAQIRGPGVHVLPTKPTVPPGITVLGFSPQTVTLTITRGGFGL